MLQFTPYYHIPWSLLHKLQQIKIKWKLARSTFFGEQPRCLTTGYTTLNILSYIMVLLLG